MSHTLETLTREIQGLTFNVEINYDEDSRLPWKECDGYGIVREGKRNDWTGYMDKKPGEVVLHAGDRNSYTWLYDWQATLALAKKDGWGLSEDKRPSNWDSLSANQKANLAVQNDFDFLKAWCDEDWVWCGVCVTLMIEDADGDLVEYTGPLAAQFHDSLWSIEYWQYEPISEKGKNSYIEDVIQELCGEIAGIYRAEQREAQAWAERDVVTA